MNSMNRLGSMDMIKAGEEKFCQEIMETLRWSMHIDRIETGLVCPGRPDLDYCLQGYQGQIELKFIDRENLKLGFFRETQVRWFRERIKHHGKPVIFTKVALPNREVQYLLHHGIAAEFLYRARHAQQWLESASMRWPAPMDWDQFTNALAALGSGAEELEYVG